MTRSFRLHGIGLLCVLLCAYAAARNDDGTLGLIQRPNSGVPTIIAPGQSFSAILNHKAQLSLRNEQGILQLECAWAPLPDDQMCASCVAPDAIEPGCYALKAVSENGEDINERAVYVVESFPETYWIAHITDTHIGTTRHPRRTVEIIDELLASVNASEAFLALITGDLTENGRPEQFREFLELLDACRLPTFVVPGNHDRLDRHYERFFGPLTYVFQFGLDGYLGFDTKDLLIADGLGPQDGALHRLRREIRASRWSIGFTHRYDLTMGMRAQLTLFVDDPLDYLLYGHYHREADEQDGIPWGKTSIIMTPAAINGYWRPIEVNAQGLHALESVHAADTGHGQKQDD